MIRHAVFAQALIRLLLMVLSQAKLWVRKLWRFYWNYLIGQHFVWELFLDRKKIKKAIVTFGGCISIPFDETILFVMEDQVMVHVLEQMDKSTIEIKNRSFLFVCCSCKDWKRSTIIIWTIWCSESECTKRRAAAELRFDEGWMVARLAGCRYFVCAPGG